MELKTLNFVIPAKYAGILEHRNDGVIRKAIENGSYPFGKVYKGQGKKIYMVATIPLLEFLGITEEQAVTALKKAGVIKGE